SLSESDTRSLHDALPILNVEMVSADRTVWSGEALSVAAPAADGDMGVLPGHQPVLTVLRPGALRVRPLDGEALELEVSGGFLSRSEEHTSELQSRFDRVC